MGKIKERWRASFYISGGTCGRNETDAFFDNAQQNEFQLASTTKEDIDLYWMASNRIF
jgi:hypothetical protein